MHDPSIVTGYYDEAAYSAKCKVYGEQNQAGTRKKIYFIFGSHRAFAYSTDLKSWKTFENNISNDQTANSLFAKEALWSRRGDEVYSLVSPWGSNLWAPDVIWNPYYKNADNTEGAWMMYMSVNGCSWNSSIALLTSDSLNGNWTYRGTVIYSGFDNGTTYDYTQTDYREVTGDASLPDRYLGGAWQWSDGNTKCVASKWNTEYGAHAIDPCILFEGDDLWMTYGSWSGGIYMIRMDKATGLRDKTQKYELKPNQSDPYMGYKLAGGSFASGEASYIRKMDDRFYLFVTNGGLNADGGYNMRVFSSDSITGPYKDLSGDDARFAKRNVASSYAKGTYSLITKNEDNINGTIGNRLMSYYKWDFMSDGNTAQGHNSVLVDDGKKFVVYHTRFVDNGYYQDRVHQIFTAKNGGLVTAPFEYCGETLAKTPYDKAKVAGSYQILTMGDVNYSAKECVTEKTIRLEENGKVTGAYSGTWQQGTDGPQVTLKCGNVTYEGVFVEQTVEGSQWPAMCLSVVGNNDISIWGYRIAEDKAAVVKNAINFDSGIKAGTYGDLNLQTSLPDDVKVGWESSQPGIISKTGKVTLPKTDTDVTVTAVISRGSASVKKQYKTRVYAKALDINAGLVADYSFDDAGLANAKKTSEKAELLERGSASKPVVKADTDRKSKVLHTYKGNEESNSYARINNPLRDKNAEGATVSLWVRCDDDNVWGEIWSFFDDSQTRLFLTQNAFFGYNEGMLYFDSNNGNDAVTNAIGKGTWKLVTVTVDKNNYAIYINGKMKYNKNQNAAYGGSRYDENMGECLLALINSSSNFYIGYGGFWGSGELSVDNLKIYNKAMGDAEVLQLYQHETGAGTPGTTVGTDKQETAAVVGKTYTVGKLKYKVTSKKKNKNYVTVTGVKSKKITSVAIGSTVKIKGTKFKVRQIGSSAFAKCKKLKKLTIGTNVIKIGKKAFYNCPKLKKITVKTKKLTSVGKSALKGIHKKAKIKVPSSKLKKYRKLFKKKGQKKTVKITK
ncbi:MAG: family 43 glycosylhydrolase [Roseburia sp.]|nr:family 43 glycosylhydrolase [Roseburia sp.]